MTFRVTVEEKPKNDRDEVRNGKRIKHVASQELREETATRSSQPGPMLLSY